MKRLTPTAALLTDLIIEVFRADSSLIAAGDELARPVGLTSSRWQVLGVVEDAPATVSHVARSMGLSRQGVQQVADALEREGMLQYEDNPHHARARLMTLTPKGEVAMRTLHEAQAHWANDLATRFSAEEISTAIDVLRRLTRSGQSPAE